VVALVFQDLFNFVLAEAWTSIKNEGAEMIAKKIKGMFNPEHKKEEPALGLNQQQLNKAKQLIKKEAMHGGMSAQKAEALALKIVGRMALA